MSGVDRLLARLDPAAWKGPMIRRGAGLRVTVLHEDATLPVHEEHHRNASFDHTHMLPDAVTPATHNRRV
jgi:hypothetical protein